jgi:YesN/AraC family two-component response regulator
MQIRIKKEDLERASHAKAFIEKDYSRHLTYQTLAHLVGTNITKLQSSFRKLTGKNLYEYLTMIRIEGAVVLLETTELTIDAIAYKVGLDRTNLNKQFKKIKGKSPSDWRDDHENNNSVPINGSG